MTQAKYFRLWRNDPCHYWRGLAIDNQFGLARPGSLASVWRRQSPQLVIGATNGPPVHKMSIGITPGFDQRWPSRSSSNPNADARCAAERMASTSDAQAASVAFLKATAT